MNGSINQSNNESPRKSDLSILSSHINGSTTKKFLFTSLAMWKFHSGKLYANRFSPLESRLHKLLQMGHHTLVNTSNFEKLLLHY